MKFKKSATIVLSGLIVFSGIALLTPYLYQVHQHSLLDASPQMNGSYLLYGFSDGGVYSYIDGTPTLLTQTGTLKITFMDNEASLSLAIQVPPLKGHLSNPNESYQQLYVENETVPMTNLFLSNFINKIPLEPGSISLLDGEQSVASTSHGMSYYINSQGANASVTKNAREIGVTLPSIVYFPDFTENNTAVSYPFPNYNRYDQAGGWNILVTSNLASGTTGIGPFLKQLLSNTSVNLPILEVTNFNIELINSNIAVGPIYTLSYISEYLPLILIAWPIGLAYIFIVHKMAKNRQRTHKGVVKK